MELEYSEASLMAHIMVNYNAIDDIKVLGEESPFYEYNYNIILQSIKQAVTEHHGESRRIIKRRVYHLFEAKTGNRLNDIEKSIRDYQRDIDIVDLEKMFLEYYKKRKLSIIGGSVVNALNDEDSAESLISRVSTDIMRLDESCDSQSGMSKKDAVQALIDKAQGILAGDKVYVTSGIRSIDNYVKPVLGECWMIAARPSIGKSAFAMSHMEHNAYEKGSTCYFLSAEMPVDQIINRFAQIRTGIVFDDEWLEGKEPTPRGGELLRVAAEIGKDSRYIIEKTTDRRISNIRSMIRKAKRNNPELEIVYIDYIQKLQVDKSSSSRQRNDEIEEISDTITDIAADLNLLIFPLAQIKRQENDKVIPNMDSLKGCGRLEENANGVIIIHRESRESPEVVLNIPKNRNGKVGFSKCSYDMAVTKFHGGIQYDDDKF